MGMGFGGSRKWYLLFSEDGKMLYDDYTDSYQDDGHTRQYSDCAFEAKEFPNRVEISQIESSSSSNGSTVYSTNKRELTLFIDNKKRLCESSSTYDENNPMWCVFRPDKGTFLSALNNNTFQSPVYKACQNKEEKQLVRFMQDLIQYFKENPDEEFNCAWASDDVVEYVDFEKAGIAPDSY